MIVVDYSGQSDSYGGRCKKGVGGVYVCVCAFVRAGWMIEEDLEIA